MPSPTLQFCGLSDIGLHRPSNQDVWIAHPDLGFFALADGMGGRKGGDIAAQTAIQSLSQSIHQLAAHSNYFSSPLNLTTELSLAIEEAHRSVYKMGCSLQSLSGMGTTLCCLLWTTETVVYAHVGDSRIYRLRKNQLELLTHDHSLFARWASKKQFHRPSPPKHIITRAVGLGSRANPEISFSSFLPDDLFLLCSDGLSDAVQREELEKILCSSTSLESAASTMINCAKNKGSSDNITVLMVQS